MRTTKPISTISFNSKEHLTMKLKELTKAKIIAFWAFIEHQPEDDEGGKKVHYHVYIEPAKMCQTEDLREEFREYDHQNPEKPRGCLVFNSSDFPNWYLYVLHDKRYLASKGQSRKYHYKHEQMISSDADDLTYKVRTINLLELSPYEDMLQAIMQGIKWDEYVARGTVPIQMFRQWRDAWESLSNAFFEGERTNRNGRENHAMDTEED